MAEVLECNYEAPGPSRLDVATVEKRGLQSSPQSQVLTLTEQDPEGCSETYHHKYSEGGTKAWLTVAGASLALFCTFGQMNAFGTFQSWYSAHQLHHLPPSTISWIGSIQLWIFFFSGGPIGRVFDTFGPRVLMTAGTVIFVFSIMMTSISTQLYQYILCQGLLFGLGVGMLFYPSLACIATYFSRYRATAIGIASAGSGLGGTLYPIILRNLFQKVGFGWGVRISGFISGLCCLTSLFLVTTACPPDHTPRPFIDYQAFKDARFTLLISGSALVALGIFIPFFYIVDYAHYLDISSEMSFYVLAVMNAGGIVGRIAPAYFADAIGRFNLLIPSAFLSGLSCLVFWLFSKSLVALMLFAATYGIFSGAFISVITPCVAQISELREVGTKMGMLYTIMSIPSLVGGPAAGALLVGERLGGSMYNGMIVFSGTTMIAGSFIILYSRFRIDPRILARV